MIRELGTLQSMLQEAANPLAIQNLGKFRDFVIEWEAFKTIIVNVSRRQRV